MFKDKHIELENARLRQELYALRSGLAHARRVSALLESENRALQNTIRALYKDIRKKDDEITYYFLSS